MPLTEQAMIFECRQATMLGVLSLPATPAYAAVIVVVGGPQYRAGSHRQFVQLARALAEAGVAALRFDVRGMGDSDGDLRQFEQLDDDIHAAVGALRTRLPELKHVVLWGLCDGAAAALLYLQSHPGADIQGICLVNPWVRSPLSRARTQIKHYYLHRLVEPEFWRKLVRGRVGWVALAGLLGDIRKALTVGLTPAAASTERRSFQDRMVAGLAQFPGDVLLIMSGSDFTAQEFDQFTRASVVWQQALGSPRVTRHTLAHANHTFSEAIQRQAAELITSSWLQSTFLR